MNEAKSLHRALFRILRPLARLLLRNGIAFGEFSELVKRAYVEAALEDFPEGRRKPTDSRAAVMTGLTRKDVKKQREVLAGERVGSEDVLQTSRASRVVSGWIHDTEFQAGNGEPAELTFDGPMGFSELVKRYSGDMPPRAVWDELVRVQMVAVDPESGKLRLQRRAYVPAGDGGEMLQIFGEDVSDLISTIDHNLSRGEFGQAPRFQRTLTYNNIPPSVMALWRELASEQAQALLERLDQWLGPHDRDLCGRQSDDCDDDSVRTGIGIFFFEELSEKSSKKH